MIYNESKYNLDWDIKTLNQLGEFRRGKSKHRPRNDKRLFVNGKYPLVQTGEITAANLFVRNHSALYNEFGLKQSKLWDKNTLCITIAANIAETALLSYPMCFPDSIVGFNAYHSESSELFMHYVFTYIKKSIQNSASGSIQDNINIDYLTSLSFRIPNKQYQDKVAKILSSLDAKIDLNNRINTELEAMAKTLYDYWFVQFDFPNEEGKPYKSSGGKMVWREELKREIPEGWEVKDLIDLTTMLARGISPKYIAENGISVLNQKCVRNKAIDFSFARRHDNDAKNAASKLIQTGDVLVNSTGVGTLGRVAIVKRLEESLTTVDSHVTIVRIDPEKANQLFIGHSLLEKQDEIEKFGEGSTGQTELSRENLGNLKLIVPPKDLQLVFEDFYRPLVLKMANNETENQHLAQLRDWLLPMLMNGQVKVQ
jgi:type I restriction enzyme S subunit